MKNENESCNDMRCCCGRLLGKLTRNGIVIKCARCKREVVIDFAAEGKKMLFNQKKFLPVDARG